MITIILEMLVRFQPDSLKYCFNMDNGYVEIIDTTHHRARSSGAVYEHIIVAERKIGRLLKPEEVVHHINKIRHDNRPDNLMIFRSNADHTRFHHGAEVYFDKEEIAYCKPVEVKYCSCCGKDLCHDTEGSLCFDCNNKKRREDMLSKYGDITKDKLFDMLKNESFLSVGKKLGVSDNMVRKICDIFGIPRHASYYRKLKD